MRDHETSHQNRSISDWLAFFWFIGAPFGLSILFKFLNSIDNIDKAKYFTGNGWELAIGLILLIGGGIVGCVAFLRAILIDGDVCVLKHSWYTMRFNRADVEFVNHKSDLHVYLNEEIVSKANGMKFSSYWSGYFSGKSRDRYFCSVASAYGVVICLRNSIRNCNIIAISLDAEVAKSVEKWASDDSYVL